ncbi:MAG: hypothetical protein K0Q79_417 [Flavipsychrobacter sp.]|jgi:hypothetical protein|nr:hypothetical protein [Flavipsychrobacter sp.]
MAAGYSQTPLAKKLGIKEGFKIKLVNEPEHYFKLFTDMPETNIATGKDKKNFIHFFSTKMSEVNKVLPKLKNEIVPDGIIWVSWPKKAAKMETDVSENLIRDVGLSCGLVDIKVCAVDETWSALKFVIPVKDRK